ncbi:MAG: hypothetical protein WC713_03545 [Candidatus Methylomirabilota bacterium]
MPPPPAAAPIPLGLHRLVALPLATQTGPAPGGGSVPEETLDRGAGGGDGHKVFLFNCHCHSFAEAIGQLLKAVPGMTAALAEALAWQVHTNGLAEVYRGGCEECDRVARILGETGLIVQVL